MTGHAGTSGRGGQGGRRRTVVAAHLIWMLYGHWAVNDPRGSSSRGMFDPKFGELGTIHPGRKPEEEQPTREELREFHRRHRELLYFPVFWLDEGKRRAVAQAIHAVVKARGWTCYACAVCSNHWHMVVRTHRDKAPVMWELVTEAVRDELRKAFAEEIAEKHPVIAARPFNVLMYEPEEVWPRVGYVEKNPEKEGLARQAWEFVVPYDNWPHHKRK